MGAETGISAHEALRRYHAAEMRLAEVEALIEQHRAFNEWDNEPVPKPWPPPVENPPKGDLQVLYLERERLQAESFRVFMASIGADARERESGDGRAPAQGGAT